jgi:hypothetical protein
VSESSEDGELSRLQRAAEFMRRVRQRQAERGKTLSGRHWLPSEQTAAIEHATENGAFIKAVKESAGLNDRMNFLAEQFEEMCRRQGMVMDADLRPAVLRLLAGELFINQNALKAPAEKLIPVTVNHGAIGPELEKAYPGFREIPSAYVRAAANHASDPLGFLRDAEKTRDALARNPEFEKLRDTPGVFTWAALCNPAHPGAWLRKILKNPEGWQAALVAERNSGKDPASPPQP